MMIAPKMLRSVLLCCVLVGAASYSALAQDAPRKGLEMSGTVTGINSATSSVSVDGQQLTLTPETYVSSADPAISTQMSLNWVGKRVEYEWTQHDDASIISDLHFTGAAR